MRSLLLGLLVASAGCLFVPARTYYQPGPPVPAGSRPPSTFLSESEAVVVAGQYAESRGLQVDRATRAHLDGAGRWHVELRGRGNDRAKVLVDARTGRVLKAQLRDGRDREDAWEDDD